MQSGRLSGRAQPSPPWDQQVFTQTEGECMRKLSLALLASGTLLWTGLLTSAQAAFLTGFLEIGGGSNTVSITTPSPLTGTIQFLSGGNVLAIGTTGSFVPLVGDAVTFPAGVLDFNTLTSDNPFVTVDGVTFTLQTEAVSLGTVGGSQVFAISGSGTFHEAGFTDTPGTFDLSTQSVGGAFTNVSFSASAMAVPGPIVGAGLPGLVSALFGGGLWWRRRQRKVA
jgi:hypothetical protein